MIFVEGFVDKELVNILGISKKIIEIEGGSGNVCNKLRVVERSVGLIDEDPGKTHSNYIDDIQVITRLDDILLKKDLRHNYLIILCPRLEEWILKAADEVGINVSRYNLSRDPDDLEKYFSKYPKTIIPLVKDIRNKDSKMINSLENMILCLTRIINILYDI